MKAVKSSNYNYIFNDGEFCRWGSSFEDDPHFSPFGPEILDIEISKGYCSGNCSWCYKSNNTQNQVTNMSFDLFKDILDKFKGNLTQIAFGITDIQTNPDMWRMFEYCRENNVFPNYTCNGKNITKEIASKTRELCGAVAVSILDKNESYDAIKLFGNKQVNIHCMVAEERMDFALSVLDDIKEDKRLENITAIVFLQYKGDKLSPISLGNHKKLVDICYDNNINYGFDSCSAPMQLRLYPERREYIEPCESGLFSGYINCEGYFYPCSFSESKLQGLNTEELDLNGIWYHEVIKNWRYKLLNNNCDCKMNQYCRVCPIYDNITKCKGDDIIEN